MDRALRREPSSESVYLCRKSNLKALPRTLANSFSLGGLAVATATDSMIYKSDVYAASNLPSAGWTDHPGNKPSRGASDTRSSPSLWGSKAVLILVGLRLGLDGVNPMYHDTIKVRLPSEPGFCSSAHSRRRCSPFLNQWVSLVDGRRHPTTSSPGRETRSFTSIRISPDQRFRLKSRQLLRECLHPHTCRIRRPARHTRPDQPIVKVAPWRMSPILWMLSM